MKLIVVVREMLIYLIKRRLFIPFILLLALALGYIDLISFCVFLSLLLLVVK